MAESYTDDELDFARERVAIMMEGEGMSYEEAREETVKRIQVSREKGVVSRVNQEQREMI